MARSFTAASTQYLEAASVPVSGWPISMACWFRVPNVTGNHTLFFLAKSTGIGYVGLSARGDLPGDPLQAYVDGGAGFATASSSASFAANTWHHALLVRASNTSLVVYLNGANSGSSANSVSWPAPTHTQAGIIYYSGSRIGPLTGDLAELAIWPAALTADEGAAMASGMRSADQIRPDALAAYWPLGGLRPDNDRDQWGKAYDLTAVNSPTSVDGPRLWYPDGVDVVTGAAAVATKYWLWSKTSANIIGGGAM